MSVDGSDARRAARQRRTLGTATDFDGDRLALARRLGRVSRSALARSASVTPAAITQFERGTARPTSPVLAELSLALGVPRDFFRNGRPLLAVPAASAHFRSLRATPAVSRDQALAFAELALGVVAVIEQHVDLPQPDLPELALEHLTAHEVAQAARTTRVALGLPDGPVGHVVRLLEAHGVLVLRLPGHIDRGVDAFSTYAAIRPLIFLSPTKDDKARSRFDAAHELGHLLLHHDVEPGNRIIENQAQAFAAEFLMPAEQIIDELPTRLDWPRLHTAKQRWGTSLKALIYRAHSLGKMSEASYRRANRELAIAGNPEPGPLGPPESPSLLGAAADLLSHHGISTQQLADGARLPLAQVEDVIAAGRDARPALHFDTPTTGV